MVGQRIQDGIDEALLTVNMSDMTIEQQRATMDNIKQMFDETAAQTHKRLKMDAHCLAKCADLFQCGAKTASTTARWYRLYAYSQYQY